MSETPPTARTAREKALEAAWPVWSKTYEWNGSPRAALNNAVNAALSAFESSLLEDLIERAPEIARQLDTQLPTHMQGRLDTKLASIFRSLKIERLPSPPLKDDQPTE